jgi:hypothetical protein
VQTQLGYTFKAAYRYRTINQAAAASGSSMSTAVLPVGTRSSR